MSESRRGSGNFAKELISDQNKFSIKERPKANQVIFNPLKNDIISAIQKSKNRRELYLGVSKELSQANPNLLIKDQTFQKLFDWEVEKIKAESQKDIYQYNLSNIKELFLDDLLEHEFAHLGRALIKNNRVPRALKNSLKKGYIERLESLKEGDFFQFVLEDYLPLIEPAGYLKNDLLNGLSKEMTERLVKESVLAKAFPGVIGFNIFHERGDIAFFLYKQIDLNSDQFKTPSDLIEQVILAQSEIIVEYIFFKLSQEKGVLSSLNRDFSDQGKINYLNQAINNSKPGFDKEILKKVYGYFGGLENIWENYINYLKKPKTLTGEDIFNFFNQIALAGATANFHGQDYSYQKDFSFSLTPILNSA